LNKARRFIRPVSGSVIASWRWLRASRDWLSASDSAPMPVTPAIATIALTSSLQLSGARPTTHCALAARTTAQVT
jgi:hypothetical protein